MKEKTVANAPEVVGSANVARSEDGVAVSASSETPMNLHLT
jgi:hypothetical protein